MAKTFQRGCQHSFAAGTLVLMADGSTKPIDQVKDGDEVLSTDPNPGMSGAEKVVDLHVNHDTDLTDLTVTAEDGEPSTLHTTQHHPFWSASRGDWIDAGDLIPGEFLHSADGTTVMVSQVNSFTAARTMRDLTVDRTHTYYVIAGNTPVLVHNCPGGFFGRMFGGKPSRAEVADANLRAKATPTWLGDLRDIETPDYGDLTKVRNLRGMGDQRLLDSINDPDELGGTVFLHDGVAVNGNHRLREALERMVDPRNQNITEESVVRVVRYGD